MESSQDSQKFEEESLILDPDCLNVTEQISDSSDNYKPFTDGFTKYNNKLTEKLLEHSANKIENVAKPGCCGRTTSNLSKQGLKSINILGTHHYISHLNISANYLTDLRPLSNLPFLQYLDASQNLISDLLGFSPPINLKYANLSYNLIQCMKDLSDFWSLECLDVSHNILSYMTGIKTLIFLEHLDLSYNYIYRIEGIHGLNLRSLILDHNEISGFVDSTLNKCTTLSVSNNRLTSLRICAGMPNLQKLDASNNQLKSLFEVTHLSFKMNWLDLRSNPMTEMSLYEDSFLYHLKKLQIFDGKEIDAYRKVDAFFKFQTTAAQRGRDRNASLYMLTYTENREIDTMFIPECKKFIPIIILVGPSGTRSKQLVKIFLDNYTSENGSNRKIYLGISCTTRPKATNEVNGVDYYFITKTEFIQRVKDGQFLSFVVKFGQYYGILRSEVQKGYEYSAIIFVTDVTGGLQMRQTYPNVKLITALPRKESTYRTWLVHYFRLKPWISTYVTAYMIINKLVESKKTMIDKRQMCASILQEIIDYIELMHEKKASSVPEEPEVENMNQSSSTTSYYYETFSSVLESSVSSLDTALSMQSVGLDDNDGLDDKPTAKFIPPWTSTIMCVGGVNSESSPEENPGETEPNVTTFEESNDEQSTKEEISNFNDKLRAAVSSITSSMFVSETENAPSCFDAICDNGGNAFIESNIKLYHECNRLHYDLFLHQIFTDEFRSAIKSLSCVIQQCMDYAARQTRDADKRMNDLKYEKLHRARYNHIIDTSY